ncbi:MAG: nitroreductase family protein [Clostridiales bacterium]|jgi:nitroreductase|nr:nitroreductase family protein [Clostridiales bacterium]
MTFDEIVKARRSIRSYKSAPIEQDKLLAVLDAGRLAPSARNRQDWRFTVVTNQKLRERLSYACCGQSVVAEAPVSIILWGRAEDVMECDQSAATVDCSIALSFMILKAQELGLGTCWLGAFKADEVAKVLDLPDGAVIVAVTPLGYPNEEPAARPRKSPDAIYDFRE